MSPLRDWFDQTIIGFPRVSGDEPSSLALGSVIMRFSPRERG